MPYYSYKSLKTFHKIKIPSASNASTVLDVCTVWFVGPVIYLVFTPVPISCANSNCEMHFKICNKEITCFINKDSDSD